MAVADRALEIIERQLDRGQRKPKCPSCGVFVPYTINLPVAVLTKLVEIGARTTEKQGVSGGVVINTMGNTCVKHGAVLVCPKCMAG